MTPESSVLLLLVVAICLLLGLILIAVQEGGQAAGMPGWAITLMILVALFVPYGIAIDLVIMLWWVNKK